MSAVERCRHCGATIQQGDEKALDGTYAVVWANDDGEWVCPVTGDEHEPECAHLWDGHPSNPTCVNCGAGWEGP